MLTPLYKKLKTNSTTNYVIAQNAPKQPDFSHFVLLDIPRQNDVVFDFDMVFTQSNLSVSPTTFADQLVESLRNYVANQESIIRGCKINTTSEYYNTNTITTPTEVIFWKWLKALKAIDLEAADAVEDYIGNLSDFDDKGPNSNSNYFREYLWRERTTKKINIDTVTALNSPDRVEIVCSTKTKFKPGDSVIIDGVSGLTDGIINAVSTTTLDADTITINGSFTIGSLTNATIKLDYTPIIKYISEITAVADIETSTKTSTEIYAHIPLEAGITPDILFRITDDDNYKPGVTFPILANEEQWEISGAENAISPIIINNSDYPGDWWGHFDGNRTYYTQSGDTLRRSGYYYGIYANDNSAPNITYAYPNFDSIYIDGLRLDFDIKHYTKPSTTSPISNTFSEFSSSNINNEYPTDFTFNAILWYYKTTDATTGEIATNLHSITFVNNPANDPQETKIPVLNKYVANGTQDGNSYTYGLDIEYGVYSSNAPAVFDPNRVYNMFNVDLFTEALKRMALLNDSYVKTVSDLNQLAISVSNLNSKIYSQSSLESLRKRIVDAESLLKLYSTMQIGNSDSIVPYTDTTVNPPILKLKSVDKKYGSITQIKTSNMFTNNTSSGLTTVLSVPYTINKESSKDFLTIINNDDNVTGLVYVSSPLIPRLEMTINEDLDFKQSAVFLLKDDNACFNKGIDLYLNYNDGVLTTKYNFMSLDLPTSLLDNSNTIDPSYNYINNNLNIIPNSITYCKINTNKRTIVLDLDGDFTDLLAGSRILLDNFKLSIGSNNYNLSGVYTLDSNATYIPSELESVTLLQGGTGYNTSVNEIFTHNSDQSSVTGWLSSDPGESSIGYTTNGSGVVTSVAILNKGNGYTPVDTNLINELTNTGTGAYIKLIPKAKTRIHLILDPLISNTSNFITDMDSQSISTSPSLVITDTTVPNGYMEPLNSKLLTQPIFDIFKGYEVVITRINDANNIPLADFNKKYNIQIEKL